ncbi:MAG: LysM peptidoglycan-binding domain-containing protein [candidate division WOR-3 bacterium]|nr:LysM peptidoglycan-binding domain-containing protein [candidate division WOR-3 bacterium]
MKVNFILLSIFFGVFAVGGFAQEKLTEEQAQAELVKVKEQLKLAEEKISSLESEISNLKSEISGLESRREELKNKLAELKETWKKCQYGRYKVVEGDWLSKIASMRNVYGDGKKWQLIYEANKDKIKNPNLIHPGMVLLIPTLETYTVIPGDCLWLIASYLSIYSDAGRWREIYEANKDKIKDKNLIYPKQVLTIPHE